MSIRDKEFAEAFGYNYRSPDGEYHKNSYETLEGYWTTYEYWLIGKAEEFLDESHDKIAQVIDADLYKGSK